MIKETHSIDLSCQNPERVSEPRAVATGSSTQVELQRDARNKRRRFVFETKLRPDPVATARGSDTDDPLPDFTAPEVPKKSGKKADDK